MSAPREIVVEGARANNLKGISVRIPVGQVTAVTGVAGAGKSSLAFDTLYAEGHRRYVETFSSYARQFLERLDPAAVDRIEGVLPAVAIDRTAPVRTSRSTVGTMTSVADYLRALYARCAALHCRQCGDPVRRESPQTIFAEVLRRAAGREAMICFRRPVTRGLRASAVREAMIHAGFRRVLEDGVAVPLEEARLTDDSVRVVLDRLPADESRRTRWIEALEAALRWGGGACEIVFDSESLPYSEALHCARCDIAYKDPTPALFSFNHPVGACEACRGFGRTMDVDPDLVVPDGRKSIAQGCVRPFQTPSYAECQEDLLAFCKRAKVRADVPWNDLGADDRRRIWEGEPEGRRDWKNKWYGIQGFFDWLEGRTYRMHIRVLLSRYRRYRPCPDCGGARLRPEARLFRLDGRTLPELEALPLAEADRAMRACVPPPHDAAAELLLQEVRGRLSFLVEVGLGYLSLSRQSRTLSGGEAQRVMLATSLGSSLVNTLYVLDEPSVGLHPRDAGRLAGVLTRLARAGNAVVVVEHDPALIARADHVVDLGPGPGAQGGGLVYQGPLPGLLSVKASRTGAYLAGRLASEFHRRKRKPDAKKMLRVRGAAENNLRGAGDGPEGLDVDIPLQRLVCVTGVSGSGKSTLLDQVLYRNVRRRFGEPESEPGAVRELKGHEKLGGVVLIDQAPLGRTSRANAATTLGALEAIRRLFADSDDARARGLSASAFSFNSAEGACPECKGEGTERVEMQFLPDQLLKCPACDGRRYRKEVLDVRVRGLSVADFLQLPAAEAMARFEDDAGLQRALEPLVRVGLGYLPLGQPAPTLSGGEAQRLKLAREWSQASGENLLYLLDEPTTGLHPDDVKHLVAAFDDLVHRGHSVVVVEHHLEVARASDWIIDLGPEGGAEGGRLVGAGTPEAMARMDTPTGRALREPLRFTDTAAAAVPASANGHLALHGAREHNLKSISIDLPRDQLIAVTGISGSGKSTLAFDVLYAEGRRRFLDCLSTYVRQFVRPLARPDVDRVEGLPPAVALEQKVTRGGRMSTVGTTSEVYPYLRLLFARAGTPHCVNCGLPGRAFDRDLLAERIARDFRGEEVSVFAPLVRGRKGIHKKAMQGVAHRGFEKVRVDGVLHQAAHAPSLDRYRVHDVDVMIERVPLGSGRESRLRSAIARALDIGGGSLIAAARGMKDAVYSIRRACPKCGTALGDPDPRLFTFSARFGACLSCGGLGVDGGEDGDGRAPCSACRGARLRPEALAVKIEGRSIADVAGLSIDDARAWAETLAGNGPNGAAEVQRVLAPEIGARLRVLAELGLSYLTLDRSADTLSTGEAQRIRVAAQLGSNLNGVLYVLDEPTVGLHPRDTRALAGALLRLRDRGNTVVVVEHDEPVIRMADHVVDLGPAAGPRGGRVVAQGPPEAIARAPESLTGKWLRGEARPPAWPRRALDGRAGVLTISGITLHNLAGLDARLPLARLVCVTGVSGSGKSTLVRDVLLPAVKARLGGTRLPPVLRAIDGVDGVQRAQEVDESPIGRTPRSVPATYVGVMDPLRALYAQTPEARARGWGASRFSFNVAGGRCEKCEGQGRLPVRMSLLPEVYVPCEACGGRRFHRDTLAVHLKGKSIADALDLTVDEARELYAPFTQVRRPLDMLAEIGLGYLRLGQPSPTLSGGEAQRIKIAAELAAPGAGRSLYVLDEPTTGLHMDDVAKLVATMQRLVDRGDSVVVIEHNLEVIAAADYVLDLGPEGGANGGQVVASGTPEEVAAAAGSRTAPFLREILALERGRPAQFVSQPSGDGAAAARSGAA